MEYDQLTSDSGFITNETATPSASYVEITPLHSNPNTHSELYTATRMGKRFVLKTLKSEHRNNELYRGLLHNEFSIGYNLSHPNIAQVVSLESIEGLGEAIVIEHIDGITLREAIDQKCIDRQLAVKIICELCDALHYTHSLQIVHRDIKPENIMLTHNGSNVKLIDFGLSCSDSQTLYKQPAGTRHYASPELLSGEKIDNRSDIYALGVIIPLMMHDRRAMRIAKRCLAKERNHRYGDTLDIKSELLRPSRWSMVAIVVGLLLLIATSSYITYWLTAMHTSAELETIMSNSITIPNEQSIDPEQLNSMYDSIEKMADDEFSQYYAQYANIMIKSELDSITLIKDKQSAVEEQAVAMLNEVVSRDDSGYAQYLSIVKGILESTWQYNYEANINTINEAIYRAHQHDDGKVTTQM